MDPQFQELAEQIANNVTQKVTIAVTEKVTAAVTKSVTASVTRVVNAHVTEVVTAAEKRLADQAKVNVEAVKDEARLVAEAYGGVLQSVEERLGRLEADLAQQFGVNSLPIRSPIGNSPGRSVYTSTAICERLARLPHTG